MLVLDAWVHTQVRFWARLEEGLVYIEEFFPNHGLIELHINVVHSGVQNDKCQVNPFLFAFGTSTQAASFLVEVLRKLYSIVPYIML